MVAPAVGRARTAQAAAARSAPIPVGHIGEVAPSGRIGRVVSARAGPVFLAVICQDRGAPRFAYPRTVAPPSADRTACETLQDQDPDGCVGSGLQRNEVRERQ